MSNRPAAELIAKVVTGDSVAWGEFLRASQGIVYGISSACFPKKTDDTVDHIYSRLRDDDFALLKAFTGKSSLEAYLAAKLPDICAEQILDMMVKEPTEGWNALVEFFDADIKRIVASRLRLHSDSDTAPNGQSREDFVQDIYIHLAEDGYRRLLEHNRTDKFGAYVRMIASNKCEDERRKWNGRRRFPEAVLELGELAQAIYRALFWEDVSPRSLVHALGNVYDSDAIKAMQSRVELIGYRRDRMAVADRQEVSMDEPGPTGDTLRAKIVAEDSNVEEQLVERVDEQHREEIFAAVRTALNLLGEEERLYFYYRRFKDPPLPAREIAKIMKIPVEQVYKLRKSVTKSMKENLQAVGIKEMPVLTAPDTDGEAEEKEGAVRLNRREHMKRDQ